MFGAPKIFWYVFDLREPYSFCGELSISIGDDYPPAYEHLGNSSYPSISLKTKLARTSSKKVRVGAPSVIEFHIRESSKDQVKLGLITKDKEALTFHVWIPDRIATHIHLTLMSSKPQLLQLFGTDLYYREGTLKSMELLKDFDEENIYA